MNSAVIYLIMEWAVCVLAFWNARTALRCMVNEEGKLQTCPKKMKFLGATVPMMLFFALMIAKTAMKFQTVTPTLDSWLWMFADLNIVIWVYFGLKMVGDC